MLLPVATDLGCEGLRKEVGYRDATPEFKLTYVMHIVDTKVNSNALFACLV